MRCIPSGCILFFHLSCVRHGITLCVCVCVSCDLVWVAGVGVFPLVDLPRLQVHAFHCPTAKGHANASTTAAVAIRADNDTIVVRGNNVCAYRDYTLNPMEPCLLLAFVLELVLLLSHMTCALPRRGSYILGRYPTVNETSRQTFYGTELHAPHDNLVFTRDAILHTS